MVVAALQQLNVLPVVVVPAVLGQIVISVHLVPVVPALHQALLVVQ
jgi:hypothetical protein